MPTGCGGVLLNSPRGSITSPNYPQQYSEESQCDWRITVNQGSTIQLIFSDIDLEAQESCAFDALEVIYYTLCFFLIKFNFF